VAERSTREEGGADPAGAALAGGGSGRFPLGLVSLLLGLLGFVVAYYVLLKGNETFIPNLDALGCGKITEDAPRQFDVTPQYRLWALLICGQTALWAAIFFPLAASLFLQRQIREHVLTRGVLLKALSLLVFLAWVFFYSDGYKAPFEGLDRLHYDHEGKLNFFNVLGGITALPALVGLWATQAALKKQAALNGDAATKSAERVGDFLALRSMLELYLLAAGVIVGAATLATGALRQALIAVCPAAEKQFMVQDVLGYGLAFSFLLALVYAPAHAQVVRTRSSLRDALVPLSKPGATSWDDWNKDRKAVGELLQANAGLFASFAGAVSIMTPLLGSLVSLLIGKG